MVGIDFHLLFQTQEHALLVARGQRFPDVDSALLEHDDRELAHGVFDGFGGEDAHAVGLLVYVEDNARDGGEGALVVLCGGGSAYGSSGPFHSRAALAAAASAVPPCCMQRCAGYSWLYGSYVVHSHTHPHGSLRR